jgi:hypothetical protein
LCPGCWKKNAQIPYGRMALGGKIPLVVAALLGGK